MQSSTQPESTPANDAAAGSSPQRYELAVSGSQVGVWDWNLQADRFSIDPSLRTLLGYDGEAVGDDVRTWRQILHPGDRRRVGAEFKAILRGRRSRIHMEHRVLHRDGGTRWLLIEGAAIRDSGGRPTRMLGTATDVTKRKWLQDRYDIILQTSMDGFWVVDGEGNILEVNDSYCRLVGYSHDELLSMRISDLEAGESPEETRRHIRRIQGTGSDRFETRHRSKDGTIIDLEISANYRETDGGRFFAFIRDVSERKQAERSLRAALFEIAVRNRITEIFLNTSDEEVFADVLAVVLDALESRYGYFGYIDDKGDLVSPSLTRDVWDRCKMSEKSIIFPRKMWVGLWGRSLLQRKTLCCNGPFEVPNGHLPLERVLVVPILHQGELVGQFAVANRPTDYGEVEKSLLEAIAGYVGPVLHARLQSERSAQDRRRAEEELKKARKNLEVRVKERTWQLTMANQTLRREIVERKQAERALIESEKLLVEAEKLAATGRMAARVAHEINNPLAGVKNAVRVIRETVPCDYPRYAHFARIDKEIDRIARIVRQMLDLNRAEREAGTEIDVASTIDDVVTMLEPLSQQYHVSVEVCLENTPLRILLPENAVRQILFNLLANAIEASPAEGTVKVSAIRVDDMLSIQVADQGPGLPQPFRSQIFEPFFTTKDRETTGGLGLGLSISKTIADSLHGSLEVESEPGRGCVFHFRVPLSEPAGE